MIACYTLAIIVELALDSKLCSMQLLKKMFNTQFHDLLLHVSEPQQSTTISGSWPERAVILILDETWLLKGSDNSK